MLTSIVVHAGNPELQDRAAIFEIGHRVVFALADGAGGVAGGALAAEFFTRIVRESAASLTTPESCVQLLRRIDQDLAKGFECGETTGLVAIVESNRICGASVGDSMAWAFGTNERIELTRGQERKPFLGSGVALARSFTRSPCQGTIVFATDGLWKYAVLELIEQRIHEADASSLAEGLSQLVRLRSGGFPDDVAIMTCQRGSA